MKFQNLEFSNARGETLAARLDLPVDERPTAYAIFAHCFTCTKNIKAIHNISTSLTRKGIAVLRFDFTGLGESEGDFSDTNFSSNVADLIEAARFLEKDFEPPKILIGHSFGGTASIQAATQVPSVVAVVTIGSPADTIHLKNLLGPAGRKIEALGEAEILLAGRPFKIKKQFIEDLETARVEQSLKNLKRALLILHSPLDETVGIENAARLFQGALHPKSFISLDQADHLLTNPKDSGYAGAIIAEWAQKYIGTTPIRAGQQESSGNRVVARIGSSGYTTEILTNGHSLLADEPLAVGGMNLGPTPYDYLVASLGACTAMTLRMYADHKKLDLEAVAVSLKHRKIHSKDCHSCDTKSGKLDLIEREIEILGPLDAAQKKRMLEIADRCPVHRTLTSEIRIESKLKE